MTEQSNPQVVLAGYEAFARGDKAFAHTVDHAWHIPGSHPLAGDFKGRDAALARAYRLQEETGGTYRLDPKHVLVDDQDHVVVVRRVTAERPGKRLDQLGAVRVTLADGKAADAEEFVEDPAATNEFWASPGGEAGAQQPEPGEQEEQSAIALVREAYESFARGDGTAKADAVDATPVLADDVVWYIPGHHAFAGEARGKHAMKARMRRMLEATGGTLRFAARYTFTGDPHHFIIVRHVVAERAGRRLDQIGALYCVTIGGMVTDVEEHVEDLGAVNEFWR